MARVVVLESQTYFPTDSEVRAQTYLPSREHARDSVKFDFRTG